MLETMKHFYQNGRETKLVLHFYKFLYLKVWYKVSGHSFMKYLSTVLTVVVYTMVSITFLFSPDVINLFSKQLFKSCSDIRYHVLIIPISQQHPFQTYPILLVQQRHWHPKAHQQKRQHHFQGNILP